MAVRGPHWLGPRLGSLSPLAIGLGSRRSGPPIRARPAVGRRHTASRATPSGADQATRAGDVAPPSRENDTGLDSLLSAVQRQDVHDMREAFIAWTNLLDEIPPDDGMAPALHDAAVRQAHELPPSTFSEIMRSMDPTLAPEHDVADGLGITWGHALYTDAGKRVDEFGVRVHHKEVLDGVKKLVGARKGSKHNLLASDFEVAMRCAGAAADTVASKDFWRDMGEEMPPRWRADKSWNEFLKSRFLTESRYYQFDRTRVAVTGRDLHRGRNRTPTPALERMDRLRLNMNWLKQEPWSRIPDEPEKDMRRNLRRRHTVEAFYAHWARGHAWGRNPDEEMMCTAIIGFARSSSLRKILKEVFWRMYGITVRKPSVAMVEKRGFAGAEQGSVPEGAAAEAEYGEDEEPKEAEGPRTTTVTGGFYFDAESPMKPTGRLLDAIVEAFGAMSEIPLGIKLLDHISQRYNVPIPRKTWSNLFNWTYLCQSKPFRTMRKVHGPFESTSVSPYDVRAVWDIMTSEPYNVQPTFEDYKLYTKSLTYLRFHDEALDIIRNHLVPHAAAAAAEHRAALSDELLQADARAPRATLARATRRRHEAETRKDYAHHAVSTAVTALIKSASSNTLQREGPFMRVTVPDLVAEFAHFLHDFLEYRSSHGRVRLRRHVAAPRFTAAHDWRVSLPMWKGGTEGLDYYARAATGELAPREEYPRVDPVWVWQLLPKPVKRLERLPRVPRLGAERGAWDLIERELMQ